MYERKIKRAQQQIKRKGQLVIWKKNTAVVNADQPWKTTVNVAPVTFPASMVFLTESIGIVSNVPAGAITAIMAAVPFTPEIDDVVLRGADNLVIKDIGRFAPNDEPILYELVLV